MTWLGTLMGVVGWRSIRTGLHIIRPSRIPFIASLSTNPQWPSICIPGHSTTNSLTKKTSLYPRGFWTWQGGDDKKWRYQGGEKDSTLDQEITKQPILSPNAYPVSVCTAQGYRSYMEDEFFLSLDGDFAAVFDGHGGQAVSRYLRKNLYANVQAFLPVATATPPSVDTSNNQTATPKRASPSVQDYVKAIECALDKVDREVQRISHWSYQGSTAVAIWLHEDRTLEGNESVPAQRTLIVANVGDSRAILSRNGTAWELTRDHKPTDPYEKERIEQSGGEVVWCGDTDARGEPILERGIYRVNGNLALSRAVGDRSERPHVTADPEIISASMQEDDEFIVVASDGLWDVMDNEDAVEFVQSMEEEGVDRQRIASLMVEEALRRGTYDNITVVIIWLDRNERSKQS